MSLIFKSVLNNKYLLNIRKIVNFKSIKQPQKRWLSQKAESESTIDYLNKKLIENKSKNILVYSCDSSGSIRVNFLGIIGGFILLGASYNTWYLFSSFRFKNRNIDSESGFYGSILKIIGSDYFKIALCFTTVFLGLSTVLVTLFFTSRSVNKMYLLKGSDKIGIVTDGIFGKEMKYVFDLDTTSFSATRKMRKSQVTFNNKKHFFYFLMNNIDGEYHEKEIFDHIICAKR